MKSLERNIAMQKRLREAVELGFEVGGFVRIKENEREGTVSRMRLSGRRKRNLMKAREIIATFIFAF